MTGSATLCEFNHSLLTRFSNRCVERLTGRPAAALPPSFTTDHLRDNVEKEAAKDCLVIERAAEAHLDGTVLGDRAIDDLFEQSKEIDQLFIARLALPSFSFEPRYEEIEDIRKKRFHYLAGITKDLLEGMHERSAFAEAVRSFYTADQFLGLIGEMLFLYCIEVKKLAGMIRFLPPFSRAMEDFVDEVVEAMEQARHDVAAEMTNLYFPTRALRSPRMLFIA